MSQTLLMLVLGISDLLATVVIILKASYDHNCKKHEKMFKNLEQNDKKKGHR